MYMYIYVYMCSLVTASLLYSLKFVIYFRSYHCIWHTHDILIMPALQVYKITGNGIQVKAALPERKDSNNLKHETSWHVNPF